MIIIMLVRCCYCIEGRDALIISAEEKDRFVIVAGTVEKLVEHLACEEKPGEDSIIHAGNGTVTAVLHT